MRLTGLTIFLLIICIPASFITGWIANDGWRSIKAIGEAMENDQNFERLVVGQIEEVEDTISETPELLDDSPALRVLETIENARVTAYTTRPEEGTTCISASGVNLCFHYPPDFFNGFTIGGCHFGGYGLIACPSKYPFGTEIEIEGHEVDYICVDRMAESHRDKNHFDIYMGRGEDRVQEADQFGIKFLQVRVLEN